ncbi:MAG TPA: hypothetical protein VH092_04820 [Urbifossiella sp.]|jgi:hypothetical protein|nr:hypothetical protein [Urbifossiella sp.]
MPAAAQALALIVLGVWVAAWWLAVGVVFGRSHSPFAWLPVAFCAFGVPMLIASVNSTIPRESVGYAVAVWASVPLVIDAVWGTRQVCRWCAIRRARTTPAQHANPLSHTHT